MTFQYKCNYLTNFCQESVQQLIDVCLYCLLQVKLDKSIAVLLYSMSTNRPRSDLIGYNRQSANQQYPISSSQSADGKVCQLNRTIKFNIGVFNINYISILGK